MKNIQRMVVMVLVCWGMVVGKSYGQNVPTLTENNLVKIWDKTLGGNDIETSFSSVKTKDNGFILAGSSFSNKSGDKSENLKGGEDIWLVKIDSKGNKIWDKAIGGPSSELRPIIKATIDGNYIILAGSSSNIGGDKTEDSFNNSGDYWLIKIDENGNKIWDKTFGGTFIDDPTELIVCKDGGFLLGGNSRSNIGGSKSETHRGVGDLWVVKTDANGNKLWDRTFGGSSIDALRCMVEIEQGFLLIGLNLSPTGGDKTAVSFGGWVVRIDFNGNKVWDKGYNNSLDISSAVAANNSIYTLNGQDYRKSYLSFMAKKR